MSAFRPPRLFRTLSLHIEDSDWAGQVLEHHRRVHDDVIAYLDRVAGNSTPSAELLAECTYHEHKLGLLSPLYQQAPFARRLQSLLDNAQGQLSQCNGHYLRCLVRSK